MIFFNELRHLRVVVVWSSETNHPTYRDPHFNLWRYFFRIQPQRDGGVVHAVDGTGICLRNNRPVYFDIPLKKSLKDWHGGWFYIENVTPGLPAFSHEPPEVLESWSVGLSEAEEAGLEDLLDQIDELHDEGLNEVQLVNTFIRRRVQPLRLCPQLLCDYTGRFDTMREVIHFKMSTEGMKMRLLRLLEGDVVSGVNGGWAPMDVEHQAGRLVCLSFPAYC